MRPSSIPICEREEMICFKVDWSCGLFKSVFFSCVVCAGMDMVRIYLIQDIVQWQDEHGNKPGRVRTVGIGLMRHLDIINW